jgi:hypothetical protein
MVESFRERHVEIHKQVFCALGFASVDTTATEKVQRGHVFGTIVLRSSTSKMSMTGEYQMVKCVWSAAKVA